MEKNEKDVIKNLDHQDAIDKFKELVKHNSICLFTTNLSRMPLKTRPMSTQKVCDQGNFWFLSDRDSDKNHAINLEPEVQLFFSNTGDSEYLTVFGQASILEDKKKIDELWTPIAKAWFTEGKDDPRISVIKVTPKDAFYWDTKSGKMISMIKIAASALAGRTMDNSVEGRLTVH